MPNPRPTRLALGRSRRRLPFERRLLLWLTLLTLPTPALAALLVHRETHSALLTTVTFALLALFLACLVTLLFEQLTRPLQTLANVVAALREGDFSFRARGALRGDSLGDLALEINALASTLQTQRSLAADALSLAEEIMRSMQSPVLAFGPASTLRLLNSAAEHALHLDPATSLGQTAHDLGLAPLEATQDQQLFNSQILAPQIPDSKLPDPQRPDPPAAAASPRFSVRRSTFRLNGIPHTLYVLTDVALALQGEERLAWQRLIRVLSHEINNSLTPIQSIAGSLRTHLPQTSSTLDLHRGLHVIEDRAAALHRFLAAYQACTRRPDPAPRTIPLHPLLERVITLETRLPVTLLAPAGLTLFADPDQLEQLLINLLHNAVEAALAQPDPSLTPQVTLSCTTAPGHLLLRIRDSGAGLANPANLFVPFYTTKPHGSGIGLVLAQQIALAHGGSLRLDNNQPPPGCTAELRLPLPSPA